MKKLDHYYSSTDKWERFKRKLENGEFANKSYSCKYTYWIGYIWVSCGFCDVFQDLEKPCKKCPLNKKHCIAWLNVCRTKNNTIGQIYNSFLTDDDEKTIKLVTYFINSMRRYKKNFK